MLGLFRPRPPLDTGEKLWTEYRMRWLAETLGLQRLLDCRMILPSREFFPDAYGGTPGDARKVFERVCGFMDLDPGRFRMHILDDAEMRGAAGRYRGGERPLVELSQSQLDDPERLVATIAHELAHDILLGGGLIAGDEEDHEHLTDLVPVYLGLGLFAANSPVRNRSVTHLNWNHFRIDRQGYLPSRMIGYGLALFAYARGEEGTAWSGQLRPDAAHPFKAGLRFLRKTGDTLFRADTAGQPVRLPTEAEAVERLATGSPTVRTMTLIDISRMEPPPPSLAGPVARSLQDRDTYVRLEAARTLPLFGEAAGGAFDDLVRCFGSESSSLRANAAAALTRIGAEASRIVPELAQLLAAPDQVVADTAASGLSRLGPAAAPALPDLIEAMRRREIDCHPTEWIATAIVAIAPPAAELRAMLAPIDAETRGKMMQSLRDAASAPGVEVRQPTHPTP